MGTRVGPVGRSCQSRTALFIVQTALLTQPPAPTPHPPAPLELPQQRGEEIVVEEHAVIEDYIKQKENKVIEEKPRYIENSRKRHVIDKNLKI